ncbi:ExbD/TolR family protein [Flavobacterium poyangense]|uniref:ExbD/TolR family protein n=1 Tax=Flavobacterium poyangense TaxID=2204302 RepID=UPI0014203424|nr:biopolymer transporter ExbD [Flavobacterium sp. JXAS1]
MQNLPQKIRSKKLSSKVDLTAMVNVSFLLIIFFMMVTELAKPKVMDLNLPDNDYTTCGRVNCGAGLEVRMMTILLDKDDKIITYSGLLDYPLQAPKKISYGTNGIRKELLLRNKAVLNYSAAMGKPGRGITVIIKPGKKSNYGNLVDILDEMAIAKINTYVIVNDFTPEESELLASK